MDKSLGFGSNENEFNSWVTGYLNVNGWTIKKLHGSMFQKDLPDHMGVGDDKFILLENKFVDNLKTNTRDSTIMVGDGCRQKHKRWSVGQQDVLREFLLNGCPKIVGGLVGVLGTTTIPDIVIFITGERIVNGFHLTAGMIARHRELAIRTEKHFIRHDRLSTFISLNDAITLDIIN